MVLLKPFNPNGNQNVLSPPYTQGKGGGGGGGEIKRTDHALNMKTKLYSTMPEDKPTTTVEPIL